jgi:hypothetical protein
MAFWAPRELELDLPAISLAAQIDQVDLGDGLAQEVGPEELEFFD